MSDKIKLLGINVTKKGKYLHCENCKTLKKEVEDHTYKRKAITCTWISRVNMLK